MEARETERVQREEREERQHTKNTEKSANNSNKKRKKETRPDMSSGSGAYIGAGPGLREACLLYTSDAADDM
eukprot:1307289-Rhodomonas_salina.1